MSAVDGPIAMFLRTLPRRAVGSQHSSAVHVYQRAAHLASCLTVEAAFRERLRADELGLGTAKYGCLTTAGRRLFPLSVSEFHGCETRRDTQAGGRATVRRAIFTFTFTADEHSAVFTILVQERSKPELAPVVLLQMCATRASDNGHVHARASLDRAALEAVDQRLVGR